MDLSASELRELATFFAKRLTPELEPLDPTRPPRPGDPDAAWLRKLEEAQARGELPELARRIGRASRGDETLEEACRLLAQDRGLGVESLTLGAVIAGGAAVAWVAITVAGLFLGAAGMAGADLSADPAVALQPQSVDRETVALQPQSVDQEAVALQPQSAPAADEEEPVRLAEAQVGEAQVEEPVAPTTPQVRVADGCSGYWYAGGERPGQAGEEVVLSHAVNVRADYPDRHNAYDARAPVRCVLQQGERVRLTRDPILVPGGKWWVPLEGVAPTTRANG